MSRSTLTADVMKVLKGEPPQTFHEICKALDLDVENTDVRKRIAALCGSKKIFADRNSAGVTRYCDRPVHPPAPTSAPAPPVDAAPDAGSVAPEDSSSTIREQTIALLAGARQPACVRDLVDASHGRLKAVQITQALRRLRNEGHVEMVGSRAGARWRTSSPGPQGTSVQQSEVVDPGCSSSATTESLDPSSGSGSELPGTLCIPKRLLARLEAIAVEIEDVTGEAIDAGLGRGSVKSLVASAGALRRALLPYNLRN